MSSFTGLNIGIVGAGIAGLSSAISLRRAGHKVTVIEATSDLALDASASVSAAANASQFFKEWDVDWASAGPTSLQRLMMRKWSDGEIINEFDMSGYTKQWGSPYLMFDRNDLIKLLLETATSSSGAGTAVSIDFGVQVTGVDSQAGIVKTTEKEYSFDMVIGSDGVQSTVRSSIFPALPTPVGNSATCLKFNVPVSVATANGLEDFTKHQGVIFWLGPQNKKIVLSPTRHLTLMSFYCFFPCTDAWKNNEPEGFHLPIQDVAELLATEPLKDLDPACYSLFQYATSITQWKLRAQEPLEVWNQGVVGLIGDAAHYMFPDQSQAPSTAIEDAAALGLIFSSVYPQFSASKEGIAQGLKVYEAVRKPRATRVQDASAKAREDVKERIGFSDQAVPAGGFKGVGEGKLTIQELNMYNMKGHIADVVGALAP